MCNLFDLLKNINAYISTKLCKNIIDNVFMCAILRNVKRFF